MRTKTNDIYSEVYSIINLLDKSYIDKIPCRIWDIIENKRNKAYTPQYDFSKNINEQDIQRETKAMIALLRISYWCDSEEEREKLKKQYIDNENNYQNELREKYNPDNLFNNKKPVLEKQGVEETAIIEYKEKNFFQKILDKIKHLFKKN